jgi:hypothetical protein
MLQLTSSFWPKNRLLDDLLIFQKTKHTLNGRRFQDTEDIKNVTTALKAILQQDFQKCFQQWQHRWAMCIAAQGE